MTEEQNNDIEEWDPAEAKRGMEAKRLKMPVHFLREDMEAPEMHMVVTEPVEKNLEITKPRIVFRPKNKSALF